MILRHLVRPQSIRLVPCRLSVLKRCAQTSAGGVSEHSDTSIRRPTDPNFEPIFSMPYIRYFALFNRLKIYTGVGSVALVPSIGLLGTLNVIPMEIIIAAGYIGVTSTLMLSVCSLLTRNMIGFVYISDDNKFLKISTIDYWGLRRNKVVPVEDWVPLNDLPQSNRDAFYLCPRLESDPTPMKLVVKLGKVLNKTKVGQFLE